MISSTQTEFIHEKINFIRLFLCRCHMMWKFKSLLDDLKDLDLKMNSQIEFNDLNLS